MTVCIVSYMFGEGNVLEVGGFQILAALKGKYPTFFNGRSICTVKNFESAIDLKKREEGLGNVYRGFRLVPTDQVSTHMRDPNKCLGHGVIPFGTDEQNPNYEKVADQIFAFCTLGSEKVPCAV